MSIRFHYNEVKIPKFKKRVMKTSLMELAAEEGYCIGNLDIVFCSDEYLLEMNKEHLKHNYYTDIITFNYCEEKEIRGELYLSIDRIKENAKMFNVIVEKEIARVVGHGVLHLMKYDDHEEEDIRRMREMEEKFISLYFSRA